MTHTLDIGTDLDDLLATLGALTADAAEHAEPAATEDRPALVSPKLIRAAWYL